MKSVSFSAMELLPVPATCLEVLLLTFVLPAAWTWPQNDRAAAGRDLTQARA